MKTDIIKYYLFSNSTALKFQYSKYEYVEVEK